MTRPATGDMEEIKRRRRSSVRTMPRLLPRSRSQPRRLVLALSAVSFAAVFSAHLIFEGIPDSVTTLYVLPIAALATEYGPRGGIAGALVSLGLVGALDGISTSVDVMITTYLVHAAVFLLIGWLVGRMADRLRAAGKAPSADVDLDGFLVKPVVQHAAPTQALAEGPEPAGEQRAVLDHSVLDSACGDDPDVRAEFATLFLGHAGGELDHLRAALDDADAPRVRSVAHSLAGGAATIGAFRLSGASNRLSRSAAAGDLEHAEAMFAEIDDAFELTRDRLADLAAPRSVD